MRKHIILLVVLSMPFNSYTQTSITAIYKKELLPLQNTSTSIKQKKNARTLQSMGVKHYRESISILEDVSFKFITNNQESIFKAQKSGLLESHVGYKLALTRGGLNTTGVYYCNEISKKSVHQREVIGQLFLVSQPFNKVKWQLENTTQIIGGFTCLKATATSIRIDSRGREHFSYFVAWYTPQIPLTLQPLGYNGLPGLLVRLEEENKFGGAILSLIKVTQHKKQIKITPPTKGLVMANEKEFEKKGVEMYKKMRRNRKARYRN